MTELIFSQSNEEWHAYGKDAGGMRYSGLTGINTENVVHLKEAWVYHTGELETYKGTYLHEKSAFEATPLMINNTLYFSTPTNRVLAIDAVTGKEKWTYNPHINLKGDYSEVTSRGVSYWPAKNNTGSSGKIFIATIDGRLISLNAKNGELITSFGNNGTIDLRAEFSKDIAVTSPPAIVGDVIVVGSSIGDNQRKDYPPGVVRAYHVHSGELLWTWDPIPKTSSDPAAKTWEGSGSGAANAWAVLSSDAERDMVFIPTSCPSPDYYGGERLGQNLYGNSVVALRASTGKMIWYYQVVHHDLWDYDIAAQPLLFDWEKEGKKIPAVAIGTKMGHIFILDRENGKPLFPVEERPVPASEIKGEKAWPTQPFPVLPAPIGLQQLTSDEVWGPTPEAKKEALERVAQLEYKGPFTPPGRKGSIMIPGNVGGIHWGGMCYDPGQKLLVTNINRLAAVITLIPRDSLQQTEKEDPVLARSETGRQTGTPYVMKRSYLFTGDERGLMMQTAPPWGTLLAIDMQTGKQKWEVPLGYMMDTLQYPGAAQWGSINFGGAIVTGGGLTFVAATMDGHLRAFDTQTGKPLWSAALPAGGQATPMTYSINGKQYLVIAAGGHGKLGSKLGDAVVAYALPDQYLQNR
ncbi:MAG: pyrroloquinoline quinone-dependent dehydrogenase [Chitinophagaceae bacterium]|nr:pyrroloquinoline quinone-dependent dehydrogenase [Chitinophagaceae bacterium]MCW5928665.1 pyrroloquinoline quinone-dependent dehydrogenase [Chitinophagaceae bacterium]